MSHMLISHVNFSYFYVAVAKYGCTTITLLHRIMTTFSRNLPSKYGSKIRDEPLRGVESNDANSMIHLKTNLKYNTGKS